MHVSAPQPQLQRQQQSQPQPQLQPQLPQPPPHSLLEPGQELGQEERNASPSERSASPSSQLVPPPQPPRPAALVPPPLSRSQRLRLLMLSEDAHCHDSAEHVLRQRNSARARAGAAASNAHGARQRGGQRRVVTAPSLALACRAPRQAFCCAGCGRWLVAAADAVAGDAPECALGVELADAPATICVRAQPARTSNGGSGGGGSDGRACGGADGGAGGGGRGGGRGGDGGGSDSDSDATPHTPNLVAGDVAFELDTEPETEEDFERAMQEQGMPWVTPALRRRVPFWVARCRHVACRGCGLVVGLRVCALRRREPHEVGAALQQLLLRHGGTTANNVLLPPPAGGWVRTALDGSPRGGGAAHGHGHGRSYTRTRTGLELCAGQTFLGLRLLRVGDVRPPALARDAVPGALTARDDSGIGLGMGASSRGRVALMRCATCRLALCRADALLCTARCWSLDGASAPEPSCYVNTVFGGSVSVTGARPERLSQGWFEMGDAHCRGCGAQVGYTFLRDLERDMPNRHQVGRYGLVVRCLAWCGDGTGGQAGDDCACGAVCRCAAMGALRAADSDEHSESERESGGGDWLASDSDSASMEYEWTE
eukprot:g7589.t1